jgi:hypothetical protein
MIPLNYRTEFFVFAPFFNCMGFEGVIRTLWKTHKSRAVPGEIYFFLERGA